MEERLLDIPSPGLRRSRHVCRVSPAGGDCEGFEQRMLATTELVTTPCHSAPPPRPPLQPSRAFRLTPAHTWSTDTSSQTPMPVARIERFAARTPVALTAV